jgi:HEAT repeat protein/cellulose biosynthesis protein BcsQ
MDSGPTVSEAPAHNPLQEALILSDGLLVTFYSYKGGVGRSFALANVAVALAKWGYRVLCVDWDLEAPGLGHYFKITESRPGLVDLVLEVTSEAQRGVPDQGAHREGEPGPATASEFDSKSPTQCSSDRPDAASEIESERWRRFVTKVNLGPGVALDLISAGLQDDGYISRIQMLDWEELYEQFGLAQSMENWRREWKVAYDYILIDSRTGVTDVGAICAAHLPDILVAMFAANDQSLDGCVRVVDLAIEARKSIPFERSALCVLPVPCRFDAREEYQKAQEWRSIFEARTERFHAPWAEPSVSAAELINRVTIPYVPYWSFGEGLPVVEEVSRSQDSICFSLETIAALIAQRLGNTGLLVKSSESYISAAARAGRRAGGYIYDIFVSNTPDLADHAGQLRQALSRMGYKILTADLGGVTGLVPNEDFDRVMDEAQHGVFLIGRENSPGVDTEIRRFASRLLDEGSNRTVLPVIFHAELSPSLPPVLRRSQIFFRPEDPIEALADLIAYEIKLVPGDAGAEQVTSPDVRLALLKLDDPNPHVRAAAVAILGRDGGLKEFDRLVDGLDNNDGSVQADILQALVAIAKRAYTMDSRTLARLVRLVESGNPHVRRAAMEVLALTADLKAVDSLVRLCSHREAQVRQRVAGILGRVGNGRAVVALITLLSDSEEGVRETALEALGHIGDPAATEWVCSCLYDKSARVSRAATRTMLRMNDPRSVQRLVELLEKRGPEAVDLVSGAIAEIGDSRQVEMMFARIDDPLITPLVIDVAVRLGGPLSLDFLLRSLQGGGAKVRVAAADALGDIVESRVVEGLLRSLGDTEPAVRAAAVQALGRLWTSSAGDDSHASLDDAEARLHAVQVLRAAESSIRERLNDESPVVRATSMEVLGKLGGKPAVDALLAGLQDSDERVKVAAVKALGLVRDPRAMGPLVGRLKDRSPDVRAVVVETLGRFGGPQVLDALLLRLGDDHPRVRAVVVAVLGELGEPYTVTRLISLMESKTIPVRKAAIEALGRIGDPKSAPRLVSRIAAEHDHTVNAAIAETLGVLGGAEAVQGLTELSTDENPLVRDAAERALDQIGRR